MKIGHGGTLDPLATGVLVAGIGKGTKHLQNFLGCTKTYEAIVLFGVSTDSYDRLGKVIGRASYQHVTRDKVEDALKQFRGSIMQRPPVFSALRVQGKHLYEYARKGEKIPVEIQKRPVTVEELEVVDWFEGGQHDHQWPMEEAEKGEKAVAEKVLRLVTDASDTVTTDAGNGPLKSASLKRKRGKQVEEDDSDSDRDLVFEARYLPRRRPRGPEPHMSGGLGILPSSEDATTTTTATTDIFAESGNIEHGPDEQERPPPAARLRMTVTSGFYVRSLCHDLGQAVGSLAIMSELVRTRQGQFSLNRTQINNHLGLMKQDKHNRDRTTNEISNGGEEAEQGKDDEDEDEDKDVAVEGNVLEYSDLAKGEEIWGPKVKRLLDRWNREFDPSTLSSSPPRSPIHPLPALPTADAHAHAPPSSPPSSSSPAQPAFPHTSSPLAGILPSAPSSPSQSLPSAALN